MKKNMILKLGKMLLVLIKKSVNPSSFKVFSVNDSFTVFPKPFIFGEVFCNGIVVKVLFGLS